MFFVCEKQEIQFEDHEKSPWGFFISFYDNWSEWKVTRVKKGQQADKLGVQISSKILAIDGELINETNSEKIEKKLGAGKSQTITFQQQVLKFNQLSYYHNWPVLFKTAF